MEGGRQSTSFRSGPVLSDYAMDDGVCLIDEFRDGSGQLSGQVVQLETDDRDQAWAFLSSVDMFLLTEMDI